MLIISGNERKKNIFYWKFEQFDDWAIFTVELKMRKVGWKVIIHWIQKTQGRSQSNQAKNQGDYIIIIITIMI